MRWDGKAHPARFHWALAAALTCSNLEETATTCAARHRTGVAKGTIGKTCFVCRECRLQESARRNSSRRWLPGMTLADIGEGKRQRLMQ